MKDVLKAIPHLTAVFLIESPSIMHSMYFSQTPKSFCKDWIDLNRTDRYGYRTGIIGGRRIDYKIDGYGYAAGAEDLSIF